MYAVTITCAGPWSNLWYGSFGRFASHIRRIKTYTDEPVLVRVTRQYHPMILGVLTPQSGEVYPF
jgi:hypothetical protein